MSRRLNVQELWPPLSSLSAYVSPRPSAWSCCLHAQTSLRPQKFVTVPLD